MAKNTNASELLAELNLKYNRVHERYEKLFWTSYMGDHTVDDAFEKAQIARENFRTNKTLVNAVTESLHTTKGAAKKKLQQWERFFATYQTPGEVKDLFTQIAVLEKKIQQKQAKRKEGYTHPETGKFTKASRAQMRELIATHDSEKVRKACFDAVEELAQGCVSEYVELVALRNQYAQTLGFEDFYAFKLQSEEQMSKKELFKIFDTIHEKTKYAFAELRKMEKKQPGLRLPWNKAYMLAGDFTKEADQYFPLEEALERWGRSFTALGITFQESQLQLDLIERKGKYDNGFCHWPKLVKFIDGKRVAGSSNFTCNAVYGQVGSAEEAYVTLFHEGGHAAHLLNSEQTEACVNNEYPPASTAWAETQSMFLDSMLSSIEWETRYAKNADGEAYPFSLFEREIQKLGSLSPLAMNGITMVMDFERRIYESVDLTPDAVLEIARETHLKYSDAAESSLWLLQVPHIYSWESACSYQGYGLAQIGVAQWREYFYKKYGYIVDNKNVGKEMKKMWKLGCSESFAFCIEKATSKRLSPAAYIKQITKPVDSRIAAAKKRIKKLESVKTYNKMIDLGASIKMVHGKETIATNKKGFDNMCETYAAWLDSVKVNTEH